MPALTTASVHNCFNFPRLLVKGNAMAMAVLETAEISTVKTWYIVEDSGIYLKSKDLTQGWSERRCKA